MAWSFFHQCGKLLIMLIGLATGGTLAYATEPVGTVAVVTDIHFNPFAVPELAPKLVISGPKEWPAILTSVSGQGFSGRGEDTNQVLLASALGALSAQAANVELIIVSGDLLGHQFQELAMRALGTSTTAEAVRELASKTAVYVADALGAALPGRPVVLALGNNDSACGDYQLEPGGTFLATLRETVRNLAGPDHLGQDFDQTYTAGGYYTMRHPRLAETTILVVSDVLWSANYQNACGKDGDQAAEAMMDWLAQQLEKARAARRRVWLVHHIPAGIDAYTTLEASPGLSCPAQVASFLQEPFATRFGMLLREYAATIQANFSGHTHQDSYRLVIEGGIAVGVEKVAPSISPIFGNNPGFHLFAYDRQTGELTDLATWYLTNLEQTSAHVPAEWRREYVFTQAYGQPTYSAAAVAQIQRTLLASDAAGEGVRSTFRRLYPVSHGELGAEALPAYACSIGNLDLSSYAACYCVK
jgi:hypothetical protein